jgi:hypothetical protein
MVRNQNAPEMLHYACVSYFVTFLMDIIVLICEK